MLSLTQIISSTTCLLRLGVDATLLAYKTLQEGGDSDKEGKEFNFLSAHCDAMFGTVQEKFLYQDCAEEININYYSSNVFPVAFSGCMPPQLPKESMRSKCNTF